MFVTELKSSETGEENSDFVFLVNFWADFEADLSEAHSDATP